MPQWKSVNISENYLVYICKTLFSESSIRLSGPVVMEVQNVSTCFYIFLAVEIESSSSFLFMLSFL